MAGRKNALPKVVTPLVGVGDRVVMSGLLREPSPPENHRVDREAGAVVYPVISRRSEGLSIGINLFPDKKLCSFDCPYCEVFPFDTPYRFSLAAMERGLRSAVAGAAEQGMSVKDFCFSGNGEPTLSPDFPAALRSAFPLRDEIAPDASIVVITNASTLGDSRTADLLRRAATGDFGSMGPALDIWLKLDAGTDEWYRKVDRGAIPYTAVRASITAFLDSCPVTIQTMLCAVDGAPPPAAEASAWTEALVALARTGNVKRVHLYGKARPAPEDPKAEELPPIFLEARASMLRAALGGANVNSVPVEVYV